jgi:hypothetical protein
MRLWGAHMNRKLQYLKTQKWDGTCTIERRVSTRAFERFEGVPQERADALIREWQIGNPAQVLHILVAAKMLG